MKVPVKTYEKPESGLYNAVLADIVDLGLVTTTFKGATHTNPMVRFVWILDVKGKDGKQLIVTQRFNISNYHEKSNIYKTMKQILNQAPDINQDLDSVLGVTRRLMISRDRSADGTKDFANVMGILPNEGNTVVPIPADFVKDRNKPVAEQAKNRVQGQQTQQQTPPPPAQQQQAPAPAAAPQADLLAQLAALQAQLKAATSPASQGQGSDVNF